MIGFVTTCSCIRFEKKRIRNLPNSATAVNSNKSSLESIFCRTLCIIRVVENELKFLLSNSTANMEDKWEQRWDREIPIRYSDGILKSLYLYGKLPVSLSSAMYRKYFSKWNFLIPIGFLRSHGNESPFRCRKKTNRTSKSYESLFGKQHSNRNLLIPFRLSMVHHLLQHSFLI